MKGDIRRDVEENLKAHETRLRVSADLQLRIHDKSWQLLRDLIGAPFEAHQCTTDFALMLAAPHPELAARREEQYQRSMEAIVKLQTFAVTAPPEYDTALMWNGSLWKATQELPRLQGST